MWSAVGVEPAFSATSFEVDRAHSCCEGHSLVTSPERPPCVWRWDCRPVYPLLEYYKWESIKPCWHRKPGVVSTFMAWHSLSAITRTTIYKTESNFDGFHLQVCNLAWSKNVNELVSTHGYSQNQIMVWKYPSMTKVLIIWTSWRFRHHFPSQTN